MVIKAIVSNPLGFSGQTIQYEEVKFPGESLSGLISYVTEYDTRRLLEALGVITMHGRFGGIQVIGQSFLVAPSMIKVPSLLNRHTALDLTADLRACLCTRVA